MTQVEKVLTIIDFINNSSEKDKILLERMIGSDLGIFNDLIDIQDNYNQVVKKTLKILCFKPNLLGFNFTTTGLVLIKNNTNLLGAITKELYPSISSTHHDIKTSPARVERAIRHSIGLSWDNLDFDPSLKKSIFGYTSGNRPSNSHYLASIHYYLEEQEDKKKNLILT